jgi:lipoprotein-anchoring transpeptidase ErfK/SrfK
MSSLSRRDFLKLSALSLAALAAGRGAARLPAAPAAAAGARPWRQAQGLLGRVTYDSSVFSQPKINLSPLRTLFRDEIFDIEFAVHPFTGPAYNPLWYKLADGYVHSAFVQLVEDVRNQPLSSVAAAGQLCRLTVPFTQPYDYSRQGGWKPNSQFLLYFDTTHWVTDVVDGPDGAPWYQLTESWEGIQYYAPAADLQPVAAAEFDPISPDVPASRKRIEISLLAQQLTAYEGDAVKLRVPISSGVRNSGASGLSTQTPTGSFNLYSKLPSKYMGDNRLTDTLGDRYLPGVPWTCFFAEGGYAIHGAYWHNNFGAPMSKGCINVRPDHAEWLYRWTTPSGGPTDWEVTGNGTRVIVS